jgi:hypothetical protein
MEAQEQTKVSKFLSGLLPEVDVNTKVGINTSNFMEAAAILFIVSVLIILSYFTFKNLFK